MTGSIRIGMLTPSSNTALEPISQAMLAGLDDVTVHFSRFPVTEIALSERALAQFDDAKLVDAAGLLAHARMDAIMWNGTSSGWLGFAADQRLCAAITAATGIPAGTSMLALNQALAAGGARRIGLVSPYLDAVQARIVDHYAALGFACAGERHLGLADNFSFAEVAPETIAGMIRAVAAERPDAIAVICTNLRAAPLVAALERELGIPIYDTVATAVWSGLLLAGADPARVTGWGRLFASG